MSRFFACPGQVSIALAESDCLEQLLHKVIDTPIETHDLSKDGGVEDARSKSTYEDKVINTRKNLGQSFASLEPVRLIHCYDSNSLYLRTLHILHNFYLVVAFAQAFIRKYLFRPYVLI